MTYDHNAPDDEFYEAGKGVLRCISMYHMGKHHYANDEPIKFLGELAANIFFKIGLPTALFGLAGLAVGGGIMAVEIISIHGKVTNRDWNTTTDDSELIKAINDYKARHSK